MALTFADTHNMIAFLTKLDASEASSISLKKTNDVVRLQALIDRRDVIITEDTVRQALRLDDADSIDCLPNEEIFAELATMRYKKPSTNAQVGDLSSHTTKYTSPALIQKQVPNDVADVVADADAEPTPPSPTHATTLPPQQELIPSSSQVKSTPPPSPHQSPIAQPSSPPPQQPPSHDAAKTIDLLNQLLETCATLTKKVGDLEQDKIAQATEITKLKQRVRKLEKKMKLKASRGVAELDVVEDVTLEEVNAEKDAKETNEAEPTEVEEVLKVVTATKLMTKVITTATSTITAALVPKASAPRRRRGVIIQDLKEAATASLNVQSRVKSKDKGKGILNEVIKQVNRKEKQDNTVMRYQSLKRKPVTEAQARKNMMVYLKNMVGFKLDFFKEKGEKEIEEEESKLSKKKSESSEQQAAKKKKIDEEVPVVDYQIHTEHNKPYYKIVRADGSHQLFLSFIGLLRNFNREDLEMLWKIPNVEANIWKNQRGIYGLAKVKSWRLLESCGVHIITFITTQMILLVERIYLLTRLTLDQMLNNIRLEHEEESEVSLKLLRFVRRQQQEGYKPDFGVDAVEDFKEYMLRDYYCWLKTYCCWYKLKLLDNAAGSS
nr:hypothetical protein [Tanacetum cinerariifolium]